MKWIITLRDTLRKLYTDYDLLLKPFTRFLVALLFLSLLKNYIGYNEQACRPAVILILSAVCSLFPAGFITFVCSGFVLANMYSVSLSLLLLGFSFMLLVVFLYFGFRPGKGIYIILIPMGFLLKIPYAIPVILALCGGFAAAVPVGIGVLCWFLIDYLHVNGSSMTYTKNISTIVSEFVNITEDIFKNEALFVMLLAFLLCIGIVAFLSRLSIDHSWTVSVVSGVLILGTVMIAGGIYTDTIDSIIAELIRIAVALPVALAYEFLFFSVDYSSTEHLQFEDDEYYYYVKAVPKITFDTDSQRKE